MELGWDEVGRQMMYIGHQLKCLSENPTNWPIQACWFHLGSFRSFCSLASRTNTGHPHTWQRRRSLFRALPGNQSQGSNARPNIRDPVINPRQMFHSKGTERYIIWILFCPMKEGMNHESLCHIHDGLNKIVQHEHSGFGVPTLERIDSVVSPHSCAKTPQQRRYHCHHDNVWLYRHMGCKATVWIEPYTWPIHLHLEKLGSQSKRVLMPHN